jgi:hypothetical protein
VSGDPTSGTGLAAFTPECLAQEQALSAAMDHRRAIAGQIIANPATTAAGTLAVMACCEPLMLTRCGSLERIAAATDTALMMAAIASAKRLTQDRAPRPNRSPMGTSGDLRAAFEAARTRARDDFRYRGMKPPARPYNCDPP